MTTERRRARAAVVDEAATTGIPGLLTSRLHPGWDDVSIVAKQLGPWLTSADRDLLAIGWPPRFLYSRVLGRWGRAHGFDSRAIWHQVRAIANTEQREPFPRVPEALPAATTILSSEGHR
jgi:hypothetical protein